MKLECGKAKKLLHSFLNHVCWGFIFRFPVGKTWFNWTKKENDHTIDWIKMTTLLKARFYGYVTFTFGFVIAILIIDKWLQLQPPYNVFLAWAAFSGRLFKQ